MKNSFTQLDVIQIRAALGWLELQNYDEAITELDQVTPALLDHPDVLKIRWMILTGAKKWEAAWTVSALLIRIVPNCPNAWIFHAYGARRLQDVQAAWDLLSSEEWRFPKEPLFLYALACLAAQVGLLDESMQRLRQALGSTKGNLRDQALEDPDLEPVRERIEAIAV